MYVSLLWSAWVSLEQVIIIGHRGFVTACYAELDIPLEGKKS